MSETQTQPPKTQTSKLHVNIKTVFEDWIKAWIEEFNPTVVWDKLMYRLQEINTSISRLQKIKSLLEKAMEYSEIMQIIKIDFNDYSYIIYRTNLDGGITIGVPRKKYEELKNIEDGYERIHALMEYIDDTIKYMKNEKQKLFDWIKMLSKNKLLEIEIETEDEEDDC